VVAVCQGDIPGWLSCVRGWLPPLQQYWQQSGSLTDVIDSASPAKATADRTSPIRWIPRRPLAAFLDLAITRTASRPAPAGLMSPRELVPTLRYDAQTVNGAAGDLERFGSLTCEILLLGGSRSDRNLTASLDGLSRVLPGARRVVLHRAGHTAADNSRQPERVAAALHDFFG
jgi:hypothetical protein